MMIYQSNHQTPTMSSTRKSSPRPQHRKLQSTAAKSSTASAKSRRASEKPAERCRGRCRVQWSEKHVKEGLVLVQEAQLARVVKTGPISEHYEIDPKPFASGQWARVYRCRSRSTGTLYAAKYSSRSRFNADCSAELRHEIALLSLCSQSPRVVRLHDVYETPKEIILVMEYAPGGDLQTLIDGDLVPLEGDVVHFVKQLVEGLAYLHERNIAHLDIKPQNLVMMGSFPESEVKLCDFEISRVILEGTEVREILGTPDYVAPEILHYEPITLAADMWSLGITTYVLLTGFSPFGGETDQETFQNISLGEVDFPEELFEDVSAQAKDFVARLLVLDPSARMSAKQCLRHDWLRDAPTQASPHLRRYLSKSREVLLERVVSRENLRRAALLSQATSHANLSESSQSQGLGGSLSQSEMCLSYSLTGSRGSLTGSECYMSPGDSRNSLDSSQTSLATSRASLATSQSCLLNKEQTQGLLSQAQSRSQANLNHVTRRGLLSRMRSLNQIQSQACLTLVGKTAVARKPGDHEMNPLFGSRSQEKLYGLRCLSKSQGVLDIYRSLECLRKTKRRKKDQRAVTEDILLPIFKKLGNEVASSSSGASIDRSENGSESDVRVASESATGGAAAAAAAADAVAQRIGMTTCVAQSSNAADGTEQQELIGESPTEKLEHKEDEDTVEDSSFTPEAETETRVTRNSTTEEFVDREESQPRKSESEQNFDSLQSVESDTLTEDSDETPLDRSLLSVKQPSQRQHSDISSHSNNSGNSDEKDEHSESETEEPKYSVAQLVSAFNKHQEVASKTSLEAIMTEKRVNEVTFPTGPKALRLFIPDINITERGVVRRKTSYKPRKNWEELRKQNEKNEGVLKDFDNDSGNEEADEETDGVERNHESRFSSNSNVNDVNEESRKTSTIDDAFQSAEADWPGNEETDFVREIEVENSLDTRIDEKYKQCVDGAKSSKLNHPSEDSEAKAKQPISNEQTGVVSSCSPRSYHQKERLPNFIFPEVNCPRTDEPEVSSRTASRRAERSRKTETTAQPLPESRSDSTVNLKDILQKIDGSQRTSKENLEKLRKRTSITKIILNDNLAVDNDSNNNGTAGVVNRAKSEPPPTVNVSTRKIEQSKLDIPSSFVRSSSLSSSESGCPTPSSVQSDIGMSWEDVHGNRGSSASLEKDEGKTLVKRAPLGWEASRPETPRSNVTGDNRPEHNRTSSVQSDIGMSWEDVHGNRGSSASLEKDEAKTFAKRAPLGWETSRPETPRANVAGDNRTEHNRTKPMTPEERRVWGKVCTGSYTRAMERFNGRQISEGARKTGSLNVPQSSEKTRRKSSPAMPQHGES